MFMQCYLRHVFIGVAGQQSMQQAVLNCQTPFRSTPPVLRLHY